jgi:hypothetical protein
MFSIDDDTQILPLVDDSPVYQDGIDKLCRSSWIEYDGKCGQGIQSKNKVFLHYFNLGVGTRMQIREGLPNNKNWVLC